MIDEPSLRAYLGAVGDEISNALGVEEVRILLEKVAEPPLLERGREVSWIDFVERGDGPPALPPRADHLAACAYGLTRDELKLIDAGLVDVVGTGFRAYVLSGPRRSGIWEGFLLDGPRGLYRLELWRTD